MNPQGEMQGKHAERGHPLHERTHAMFNRMAASLLQGQEQGTVRSDIDALQLSEIAFAIWRTTIHMWLTNYWDEPGDLVTRVARAFQVFGDGIKPREDS